MNTVNEVQESIKIALDAADAATDITSEYNKIKNENKKLEASVKQVHKFTTIIFGIMPTSKRLSSVSSTCQP